MTEPRAELNKYLPYCVLARAAELTVGLRCTLCLLNSTFHQCPLKIMRIGCWNYSS